MDFMSNDLLDRDTTCLGRFFPVEIWKLIAGKLDNPECLNNSSPFFRNLLKTEMKLFLFDQIIIPLTRNFWGSGNPDVLSVQDLLKCRQVCKTWNTAVDEFIRNACHYSEEKCTIYEVLQSQIKYGFWHEDTDILPHENVFHFLNFFDRTHPGGSDLRSPFILPNLLVNTPGFHDFNDETAAELDRYLDGISTLLHKYGKHVTDFTVEFNGDWFGIEYAICLQKWLVLMPNLINLAITDLTEHCDIDISALQNFYEATPFPKLRILEKMKAHYFTSSVFKNLIQQNSHISTLDIKLGEEQFDVFSLELPHLTKLKIEFDENSEYIPQSVNSPKLKWPVKILSISLKNVQIFRGWKEFFQEVQVNLGDTLEFLSLKLPVAWKKAKSVPWQNSNELQLYLPKLIEIYLKTSTPISLDFLLPMKKTLKYILVHSRYTLPSAKPATKSVVEFCGWESEERIMEANIWTQFENLEKIGISHPGSTGINEFYRKDSPRGEKIK